MGASKAALILMKNSHFDRTLRYAGKKVKRMESLGPKVFGTASSGLVGLVFIPSTSLSNKRFSPWICLSLTRAQLSKLSSTISLGDKRGIQVIEFRKKSHQSDLKNFMCFVTKLSKEYEPN